MSETPILYSRLDPTATAPVFVPDPMPPTTPPQLATTITWPDSPPPAFYHNQRVGRAAGGTFIVLGAFFGLLTRHLYFHMTGKPTTVIYTVRACAGATVLTPGVGICLLVKPYWNDPRYRTERGKQAEAEIKRQGLNFTQIVAQYGHLRDQRILDNEGLNVLLHQDVAALDYQAFIDKHGFGAVNILNEAHKGVLRERFLSAIPQTERATFVSRYSQEIRSLGISANDTDALFREREAATLSFEGFRSFHRERISEYDPKTRTALAASFLRMPYQRMISSDVNYAQDRADLQITDPRIQFALHSYATDHTYGEFRSQHGTKPLEGGIMCAETRSVLKSKFLALPYREMVDFKTDRDLLDLTLTEIEEAVNAYLMTHSYLHDGRANYREAVVAGVLYPDSKTKIKEELQTALQPLPYGEIKAYDDEIKAIDIDSEWIATQLRPTLTDFSTFYSKHAAGPLRDGVLNSGDIQTLRTSYVQYLKEDLNRLNRASAAEVWGGLKMDEPGNQTGLKASIQQTLSDIDTFEEFQRQIPQAVFTQGLLSRDDPGVVKVVKEFFLTPPYWRRDYASMANMGVIPSDIQSALADAGREQEEISRKLDANYRSAEEVRDARIEREADTRDAGIELAKRRLTAPLKAVERGMRQLSEAKKAVAQYSQNAPVPSKISKLQTKIENKTLQIFLIERDRRQKGVIRAELEKTENDLKALLQTTSVAAATSQQRQRQLGGLPETATGYGQSSELEWQRTSLNRQLQQTRQQEAEEFARNDLMAAAKGELHERNSQRAPLDEKIRKLTERLDNIQRVESLKQELQADQTALGIEQTAFEVQLGERASKLAEARKREETIAAGLEAEQQKLRSLRAGVEADVATSWKVYKRAVASAQEQCNQEKKQTKRDYLNEAARIDQKFEQAIS